MRLQIQVALAGDGLSGIVTNLIMATAGQLDIPSSRVSDLIREARIHNSFTVYGNRKKAGNYYQRQKQRNYSRYENGHDALKHINVTLDKGEMAFLTGHSGAGKSTLLNRIIVLIFSFYICV